VNSEERKRIYRRYGCHPLANYSLFTINYSLLSIHSSLIPSPFQGVMFFGSLTCRVAYGAKPAANTDYEIPLFSILCQNVLFIGTG
jgi:hypothetical protein